MTTWPNEVLQYTRHMSLNCNPMSVVIKSLDGRGHLATLYPARAGTEESIEASDSWGRILAFLLALMRLGVPSEQVIGALMTCVGPHDDLYAKGLRDAAAKVRELAEHAGTDRGFLDQLVEDILRGN